MVGIDDSPPPPMELGEPGSAEFSGFEVDILEAVAERLGLTLRYRRAVWSQILDELDRGLIDVVCTAATYTPERARQFDYGRPYLDMALGVVVRDDAPDDVDRRGRAPGRRWDVGHVAAAVVRRRLTRSVHASQRATAITTVPITWAAQKIACWVLWRQTSIPAHPPAAPPITDRVSSADSGTRGPPRTARRLS